MRDLTPWQRALLLLLVAVGVLGFLYHEWIVHQGIHYTGLDAESGPWYGFWSGFGGSFLAPQPALLTVAFVTLRHMNCHVKGCPRPGHPVGGTQVRVCHVHDDEHPTRKRNMTHEELLAHIHRTPEERREHRKVNVDA